MTLTVPRPSVTACAPLCSTGVHRSTQRDSKLYGDKRPSVQATFARLDPLAARIEIGRLADNGMTEAEIAAGIGWSIGDVCRALAGRL